MKLSDLISSEGKLKAFNLTVPPALQPYSLSSFIGTTCDLANGNKDSQLVLDVLTILENIEEIEKYGELDIVESFKKATDKFVEVVQSIPEKERPIFVFSMHHAAQEIKDLLDSDMSEEMKTAIKNFDIDSLDDTFRDDDTLFEIDEKMESVIEDLFDDTTNPFLKKRKKM